MSAYGDGLYGAGVYGGGQSSGYGSGAYGAGPYGGAVTETSDYPGPGGFPRTRLMGSVVKVPHEEDDAAIMVALALM